MVSSVQDHVEGHHNLIVVSRLRCTDSPRKSVDQYTSRKPFELVQIYKVPALFRERGLVNCWGMAFPPQVMWLPVRHALRTVLCFSGYPGSPRLRPFCVNRERGHAA